MYKSKWAKSKPAFPTENKLHARKVEIKGRNGQPDETFDSRAELKRYLVLCHMQRRGEITDLQRQVRYKLTDAHRRADGRLERAAYYVADFVYTQDGKAVVEDVKGYTRGSTYNLFALKRKIMLEKHGIEVQEIHV